MHFELLHVALEIACTTMRKNTERPVTVAHGINQLVGFDSAKILAAAMSVKNLSQTTGRQRPDHRDGAAAGRDLSNASGTIIRSSKKYDDI